MVPGVKFSVTTSAQETSFLITSSPSGRLRFTVIANLLAFMVAKYPLLFTPAMPSLNGVALRKMSSREGVSILITVAP